MRRHSFVVVAVAALLVAACQTSAPPTASPAATTPGSPSATSPGHTATSVPGTSATASATSAAPSPTGETPTPDLSTEPVDFEIGPGTFFLDDPRWGLDTLDSYTQTLTVTFAGTADGQPSNWTTSDRLQRTSQPASTVLTREVTGDAEASDPKALAEAAGATYQVSADGSCSGRPLNPDDAPLTSSDPATLLPGLLGAEEAGSETVNGVPSSHYTFDGRALLEADGPTTTGAIWVASDGGYVVRFIRSTNADASYLGGGLAGEMTWDYQLTDVNTLTDVALPEGCQLDAPVLDDATNLLILPEYLGFDTASSVGDAMEFYTARLPPAGWTLTSDPSLSIDTAIADFTKGADSLHVIVTTGESGTHVDVALTTTS